MPLIVGVRFKEAGKIYYFDPASLEIEKGNDVIVETIRGIEYGEVVIGPRVVEEDKIISPLKSVIRIATEEDLVQAEENRAREKEAFNVCLNKIAEHGLPMKLIDVEITFDRNKIIFYFTADGRIDFRELVKDLAAIYKTRIELRQIGVRDEAKMVGGIGPCGRHLCCNSFLCDFHPVSIKMAKEQNLSLNPTKISGACGRLMCCLNYEQDFYEEISSLMPDINMEVGTPEGLGTVIETNILLQRVKVKMYEEDETIVVKEFSVKEIEYDRSLKKARENNIEKIECECDCDCQYGNLTPLIDD